MVPREESFVLKPDEARQKPQNHDHLYLPRMKVEDGEIGIFATEKYFKGRMDEEKSRFSKKVAMRHQHEKDKPLDHTGPLKKWLIKYTRLSLLLQGKNQLGTSSAHSESSALLNSVLRNPSQRKPKKVNARSFLASLGCHCSCNDMNSVDVDENNSKSTVRTAKELIKKAGLDSVDSAHNNLLQLNSWVKEEKHRKKLDELGLGLKRKEYFSFPVVNSNAEKLAAKMQFQEEGDDKPRKSLEAFGSPILETEKTTLSFERSLAMSSWDATTSILVQETEIPETSDGMFNDHESDASSDLFEIESFKSNANPYAPSEASIEWSVVTASAADFSFISDSEELRPPPAAAKTTYPNKMVPTAKTTLAAGEIKTRRPDLLGCKSYKTVRIAEDHAYRTSEKAVHEPRRQPSQLMAP